MDIIARDVVVKVVDQINLTADQWDPRPHGKIAWRDHMAKILNLRVQKLAPQCDAIQFYTQLARFASEIGFGDQSVVVAVAEHIYNCHMRFTEEQAA